MAELKTVIPKIETFSPRQQEIATALGIDWQKYPTKDQLPQLTGDAELRTEVLPGMDSLILYHDTLRSLARAEERVRRGDDWSGFSIVAESGMAPREEEGKDIIVPLTQEQLANAVEILDQVGFNPRSRQKGIEGGDGSRYYDYPVDSKAVKEWFRPQPDQDYRVRVWKDSEGKIVNVEALVKKRGGLRGRVAEFSRRHKTVMTMRNLASEMGYPDLSVLERLPPETEMIEESVEDAVAGVGDELLKQGLWTQRYGQGENIRSPSVLEISRLADDLVRDGGYNLAEPATRQGYIPDLLIKREVLRPDKDEIKRMYFSEESGNALVLAGPKEGAVASVSIVVPRHWENIKREPRLSPVYVDVR